MINELTTREEITFTEHKNKEDLLWIEFGERMDTSSFLGFTINPADLIKGSLNLQNLEDPFTTKEIDSMMKTLPNNKSPGPDGYNNEFLKAAWSVVKHDFYDLCSSFYNNSCYLQSINSSNITLIPKTLNGKYVSDYRPISLLNSSVKLLTKLLANML